MKSRLFAVLLACATIAPAQKKAMTIEDFDYSTVMTSVQAVFGTQMEAAYRTCHRRALYRILSLRGRSSRGDHYMHSVFWPVPRAEKLSGVRRPGPLNSDR